MNAINHAATALIINKKWPGVPIVPVLLSVQLVEFLWVVFNLLGIEVTTTELQVRALNDIHLAYMPYSHSIAATVVLAFTVWVVVAKLFEKPIWGLALAVAVSSHIALDLATHVHDIAIAPGIESPKFGSGLYGVPLLALVVETIYGVWCWWVFRGSRALLAVIVLFNLAALSFYSPSIHGPEYLLAGRPRIFAALIGMHIIAGLVAVGYFARSQWRDAASAGSYRAV
ncbi:hypothetical protein GALL_82080 [mine drainage metagenome]|uniref:Membrane-bound metal-dependent hydrolase n=1 Tax=mine drainage metagenome TaxID=410659 RepID=A0A1J5SMS7_9ZZZZ